MSTLDINTPRGQVTLSDEEKAVKLFETRYPQWRYISTDKTEAAQLDALLIHDDKLGGLALTSCRYDCTVETMMTRWDAEWLLTWRKLAAGAVLARRLKSPLIGFIYFADEGSLLIQQLYNPTQMSWATPFRCARTETQATVNGGRVVRFNAYIKVNKATRLGGTDAAHAPEHRP